jgi:hypothetical protein
LQKGFLSRDQAPKEEEMPQMSEHMTQLETYPDLEASIIKVTKINKVLKAIQRLPSIPREEEFNFKDRSTALLEVWNKALVTNGDATAAVPATNGVSHSDKPTPEVKPAEEKADDTPAPAEASSEKAKEPGDVTMKEAPAAPEEPAALTAAEASVEVS